MFAALILAAAVATAAPAPAWEPLACIYCDASEARAIGWSFETATASHGPSAWADYIVPDTLRRRRFASQNECLRALRQTLPVAHETDDTGQITTRRHQRDHITETQTIPGSQTGTTLYGCFQHLAAVG